MFVLVDKSGFVPPLSPEEIQQIIEFVIDSFASAKTLVPEFSVINDITKRSIVVLCVESC